MDEGKYFATLGMNAVLRLDTETLRRWLEWNDRNGDYDGLLRRELIRCVRAQFGGW